MKLKEYLESKLKKEKDVKTLKIKDKKRKKSQVLKFRIKPGTDIEER